MHQSIQLLAIRCPAWAKVTHAGTDLDIEATVVDDSGRPLPTVALRVSSDVRVRVSQRDPARWPTACPERHIEVPGTLCLGKGEPLSPASSREADTWWEWLREFITSQFFADRNQFWPSGRALHHGDAANVQLQMEAISAHTCFEEDVRNALENGKGWLAQKLPRLTKDGTRLVNQRAPCPRGCQKRRTPLPKGFNRKPHPILRKSCKKADIMFALVKLERERRKKDGEFWDQHPRKVCCGTMSHCPLKKGSRNE